MRKLREYKGVTYHSGGWWANGYQYKGSRAASAIISYRSHDLTDDDHPELMRLKEESYKKAPRLEDVIESAYDEWRGGYSRTGYKELIAWRIRQSFPHIDQEER